MRLFLAPHRCPGCEIRKPLCFCSLIPKIALQTRVMILMHTCEEVLTTNTARLAAKALTNSEVRIHGRRDERMITSDFIQPGRTSLLLYPSPISVELTPEFVSKIESPVHLIVPDANWRQTTKPCPAHLCSKYTQSSVSVTNACWHTAPHRAPRQLSQPPTRWPGRPKAVIM